MCILNFLNSNSYFSKFNYSYLNFSNFYLSNTNFSKKFGPKYRDSGLFQVVLIIWPKFRFLPNISGQPAAMKLRLCRCSSPVYFNSMDCWCHAHVSMMSDLLFYFLKIEPHCCKIKSIYSIFTTLPRELLYCSLFG